MRLLAGQEQFAASAAAKILFQKFQIIPQKTRCVMIDNAGGCLTK